MKNRKPSPHELWLKSRGDSEKYMKSMVKAGYLKEEEVTRECREEHCAGDHD